MEKRKHWGLIPHRIATPLPIVYDSDHGLSVYPYLDLRLAEEKNVWGIRCGNRLWARFHVSTCSKKEFERRQEADMFPFKDRIAPDLPTCEQLEEAFKHKLEFDQTVRILSTYGVGAGFWKDGQYLTSDMKDDEHCYVFDMSKGIRIIQNIHENGFVRLCYPAY